MQPLGHNVAILPIKDIDNTTESGIILSAQKKPLQRGVVSFVSKEVSSVAVGDTVVYPTGSGVPITENHVEYTLLGVYEIKAKIV